MNLGRQWRIVQNSRPYKREDSYYYTVRSDDVKALKPRWNFIKTKTTTPGNNIYTLLITFIDFTSFISSKFQTLFFPYKLSYYTWATCDVPRHNIHMKNTTRNTKSSTSTVTLLNKTEIIRRIVTAITVVPKESRVPFGFNCWQSSLFGAVRTCFDHVVSNFSGFSWERILFLESAGVQYGDANSSSNWRY